MHAHNGILLSQMACGSVDQNVAVRSSVVIYIIATPEICVSDDLKLAYFQAKKQS